MAPSDPPISAIVSEGVPVELALEVSPPSAQMRSEAMPWSGSLETDHFPDQHSHPTSRLTTRPYVALLLDVWVSFGLGVAVGGRGRGVRER